MKVKELISKLGQFNQEAEIEGINVTYINSDGEIVKIGEWFISRYRIVEVEAQTHERVYITLMKEYI